METLAVVFACHHFHDYLYGRSFVIRSDHQPLSSIFKQPLHRIPPRLQRFSLNLQRYDFIGEYIKGRENIVADTFSRTPLKNNKSEINVKEMNSYIHMIKSSIPISVTKMDVIKQKTSQDEVLTCLRDKIQEGWPIRKNLVDQKLLSYFNFRNELSEVDGLIMRGNQIVIPLSMRLEIRNILHQGHLGIERTKNRARSAVFWPNMNAQLKEMVQNSMKESGIY